MALDVVWAEAALVDLELAAGYIARDSPRYASVLVKDAREAAYSLATFSKRGRVVPEVNDERVRELFVCNYRLIYRLSPGIVHILAFIHGSRDLWAVWKKRP